MQPESIPDVILQLSSYVHQDVSPMEWVTFLDDAHMTKLHNLSFNNQLRLTRMINQWA